MTQQRKTIKTTYEKLVIDESISKLQLSACQKEFNQIGITYQQLYLIAIHHPGMPDNRILRDILNKQDALLTNDRPFHNRLLVEGFISLYVDNTLVISRQSIKGIQPAFLPQTQGKEQWLPEMSALHPMIMPESDQALKKLRTKRRRIRNHFGGYDQLSQLSITVATRGNLIGLHLQVAGSSAKGIRASESYINEIDTDMGGAALCHALILTLQLMLQRLDISLFYDPSTIPDPYTINDAFFKRLKSEFPKLKFIACPKGRFMESLWQKIHVLNKTQTNEIVSSRLAQVKYTLRQETPIETPSSHVVTLLNPNTDRGALLLAAKWFYDQVIKLNIVTRIALIGSICTEKKHPKDIDILLTMTVDADITLIAKLKRQMSGRIQRGLLGADIFLMDNGQYMGRPCRYREQRMRLSCANDGLRCDLDRPFRCDTTDAIVLKGELLETPAIILYPTIQARVNIPEDVQTIFGDNVLGVSEKNEY